MMYFIKKDTLDNLAKSVQRVSFKEDSLTPSEMSESLDQIKVADHMLIDEDGYYPEHYLISGQILADIAKAIDSGHKYTEGQMNVDDMERKISEALGYAEEKGKTQGIEEGKKAEHDRFWDAFQQNGNRRKYDTAFGGGGFSVDNFYPKYDIIVKTGSMMFYNFLGERDDKTDPIFSLKERLEECGVVLDTSQSTNLENAFGYCRFSEIPTIDFTGVTAAKTSLVFCHSWGRLKTIEKIIVNEKTTFNNWFINGSGITNITVEGTIANDINFQSCPLSVESAKSVINALLGAWDTDSFEAYSKTVYFSDATKAALEAEEDAPVWGNWLDFIVNEKGWNVG